MAKYCWVARELYVPPSCGETAQGDIGLCGVNQSSYAEAASKNNKSSKWRESGGQTSKAMKCRGVVLMIHLEKHKERRQNIENFLAVLGVAGLHHVEWVSLGL